MPQPIQNHSSQHGPRAKYLWSEGQAALVAVIIISLVVLTVTIGTGVVALVNQRATRNVLNSAQSYYTAESGLEDSLLRIINSDYAYTASNTLAFAGSTATIDISQSGDELTVTSEGDKSNLFRSVSTTLQENTSGASFFYGVQVDEGGLFMNNNARINGNVYSNGSIEGGNGAVITGDAIVAGGIDNDPQDFWETENADQLFASASGNQDIAQSFTPTESGPLPQIAVYLGKVGNPSSNINIRITTDNSGKPDTSSLASTAVSPSQVGSTPNWVNAAFESPANVASGTKYWIVLDYGSNSGSNHWNWRKDTSDGYTNNTGRYTSSWSSGSATWTDVGGDLAFRAWIGGTQTYIDNVDVGSSSSGTGRANLFLNTDVHGSPCPNQYCLIENNSHEQLPILEETIQGWKDAAEAGGIHSGDYSITDGSSETLGPLKITGNLLVDNNSSLTLNGTIWVQGDIQLSNNCIVDLDAGYGANSGVLLTDGVVQVSNNCTFDGSGDPDSYIFLMSEKDDPNSTVMTISNNALGVVYYARRGRIHFSNNAAAKEATAYGMTLDNGATITYESGLENVSFSSGPAGGWNLDTWVEIE